MSEENSQTVLANNSAVAGERMALKCTACAKIANYEVGIGV
jgi:hypothetical protein